MMNKQCMFDWIDWLRVDNHEEEMVYPKLVSFISS
jgi:hypothetical protein